MEPSASATTFASDAVTRRPYPAAPLDSALQLPRRRSAAPVDAQRPGPTPPPHPSIPRRSAPQIGFKSAPGSRGRSAREGAIVFTRPGDEDRPRRHGRWVRRFLSLARPDADADERGRRLCRVSTIRARCRRIEQSRKPHGRLGPQPCSGHPTSMSPTAASVSGCARIARSRRSGPSITATVGRRDRGRRRRASHKGSTTARSRRLIALR